MWRAWTQAQCLSQGCGKRLVTGDEGFPPVTDSTPPNQFSCVVCGVSEMLKKCSGCHTTHYCSKKCQLEHWPYHSVLCGAISELEKLEKSKAYGDKSVRQPQVDDCTRRKVLNLVGDKPKFRCFLNDVGVG